MSEETKEPVIEIRKYANRRLYDKSKSQYVTLSDVAQMIRDGKEIKVVDAKTNEDLTKTVMLQIICESKTGQDALPIGFLRKVIQASNKTVQSSIKEYLSIGLNAQKEFQKQVSEVVRMGMMMNPFLAPFVPKKDKKRRSKSDKHPEPKNNGLAETLFEENQTLKDELSSQAQKHDQEIASIKEQFAMLQEQLNKLNK